MNSISEKEILAAFDKGDPRVGSVFVPGHQGLCDDGVYHGASAPVSPERMRAENHVHLPKAASDEVVRQLLSRSVSPDNIQWTTKREAQGIVQGWRLIGYAPPRAAGQPITRTAKVWMPGSTGTYLPEQRAELATKLGVDERYVGISTLTETVGGVDGCWLIGNTNQPLAA